MKGGLTGHTHTRSQSYTWAWQSRLSAGNMLPSGPITSEHTLVADTTWHAYVRRQREAMPGQAAAGVWRRFPLTVVRRGRGGTSPHGHWEEGFTGVLVAGMLPGKKGWKQGSMSTLGNYYENILLFKVTFSQQLRLLFWLQLISVIDLSSFFSFTINQCILRPMKCQ